MQTLTKFVLLAILVVGGGVLAKNTMFSGKAPDSTSNVDTTVSTSAPATDPKAVTPRKSPVKSNQNEAPRPSFEKGEAYAKVREKLLSEGWQPYTSRFSDKCMQGDRRCEGRPEMEACSGTGAANCKFVWQRGEHMLSIFTVGMDAEFQSLQTYKKSP